MFRRSIYVLCTSMTLAAAIGCGSDDTDGTPAADSRAATIAALTPNVANGDTLYGTNCSTCHGTDGKSGTSGKNIASAAVNDKLGAIEQIITGGGGMSSFSSLSDQQIADIVGHTAALN